MFFCIFYFVLVNRLTRDKKIAIIIQNKYFVQYRGVKNRKFDKNSCFVVFSALNLFPLFSAKYKSALEPFSFFQTILTSFFKFLLNFILLHMLTVIITITLICSIQV